MITAPLRCCSNRIPLLRVARIVFINGTYKPQLAVPSFHQAVLTSAVLSVDPGTENMQHNHKTKHVHRLVTVCAIQSNSLVPAQG